MTERTILVWFRNDLRVRDNEILSEACKKADRIIPVYCFDPRNFEPTHYGTKKTGNLRAKFLTESVTDLRLSLQKLGGNLLVAQGKPEDVLPEICRKYNVNEVYHHREVAVEETEISALVEAALWKSQINLKHFIGHTLYHKEDLPFPIKDIPDAFATFRKKIERESIVRPCFDMPAEIIIPGDLEKGELPLLSDLGLEEPEFETESKGGETAGHEKIREYFWEKGYMNRYKSSKGTLSDSYFSSRLSAWISLGCLSTRQVYWEIKKYAKQNPAINASSKFAVEFLWRDYFRFMYKKYSGKLFETQPEVNLALEASNKDQFEKWKTGQTGVPIVDACMRELNATGFLNNAGRQVAATFLVNNLHLDWRRGAAYFEEKLIDYSPASNRGNWAILSGVSIAGTGKKSVDVFKQASELDPEGEYVRKWAPELAHVHLNN